MDVGPFVTVFIGGPMHRRFLDLTILSDASSVAVRVPTRGDEVLEINDWGNADGERLGRYDRVSRETAGLTQLALVAMGDNLPLTTTIDTENVMVWMGWKA